jgi:hypothetical protein
VQQLTATVLAHCPGYSSSGPFHDLGPLGPWGCYSWDAANTTRGFVFQFCTLAVDNDLLHANFIVNTNLGRPWRKYSRVIFMQSFMSNVVHPDGCLLLAFLSTITKNRITPTNSNGARNDMVIINLLLL